MRQVGSSHLNPNEILKAKEEGIEFLSEPFSYPIDDSDYHSAATENHFWVKWRFRAICKIIPKERDLSRAIEIGCGRSSTRKLIENYFGCFIDGCDINLAALRMDSKSSGNRYFYDICERYEAWKDGFSTIFLLDVIEHIKDPVNFLKSVSFHLKQGGVLIINIPAFQFFYSLYDGVQGHTKRYSIKDIKEELCLSGFYLEKARYWGILLVPIILMRKFAVYFFPKRKVLKYGFQPASRFISFILEAFMRIECTFFPHPPAGSSLLIVARKM